MGLDISQIEIRRGESLQGLRMTADEYMALPEIEDARYELINGVVIRDWYGDLDPVGGNRDREIYHGLRMTADEFMDLGETFERYELVNGVVLMSPSATPEHQAVVTEILRQLANHLADHPIGKAVVETDIWLEEGLVYRPEIVFLKRERAGGMGKRLKTAPDMVVEVVSRDSRWVDTVSKKNDYERFGVGEYWLFDPERRTTTFYRLAEAKYLEVTPVGDRFRSEVVAGFELDLARVRETFKPW